MVYHLQTGKDLRLGGRGDRQNRHAQTTKTTNPQMAIVHLDSYRWAVMRTVEHVHLHRLNNNGNGTSTPYVSDQDLPPDGGHDPEEPSDGRLRRLTYSRCVNGYGDPMRFHNQ